MTDSRPPRVLVVDDDAFTRTLLATILTSQGIDVVAQADDGDQVAAAVDLHRPDVVLMDLVMRRVGGIEATRMLCRRPSPPAVVALTSFAQDETVIEALTAGAVGFLVKDSDPDKIARAVHTAASGQATLDATATRAVVGHIAGAERDTRRADATRLVSTLTERERQVAAFAGTLTNEQIGRRLHLSASTVKQHLSSASDKVGTQTRAGLAVIMDRAGLTAPG